MPWVAKLLNTPKLTGGFPFVEGFYYIVTREDPTTSNVTVINKEGKRTRLTRSQSRDIFQTPKWISDKQYETLLDKG